MGKPTRRPQQDYTARNFHTARPIPLVSKEICHSTQHPKPTDPNPWAYPPPAPPTDNSPTGSSPGNRRPRRPPSPGCPPKNPRSRLETHCPFRRTTRSKTPRCPPRSHGHPRYSRPSAEPKSPSPPQRFCSRCRSSPSAPPACVSRRNAVSSCSKASASIEPPARRARIQ